ncbi:MAG TPA: FlgD immunoglobulin-like domain containing protein [Candidatus Krumholzibacteria bacterium]
MGLLRSSLVFFAVVIACFIPVGAAAQCILANPSFELAGSGGAVFGGWSQFGPCGSSTTATHGHKSAKVSGPNLGGWDVAGYWQAFDCAPGEQWVATVRAWHSSAKPLTGQSQAIVNIEWRNAGGTLISYESHTAAGAGTPLDVVQNFSVTSGPAPAGTTKVRLLLAVLQAPGTPVPDVFYDQATFEKPGVMDAAQWGDFPSGRTLAFSGRTWRVKGTGYYGPGPNNFDSSANAVWVDVDGRLHITIRKVGSTWYSSEVVLQDALGYGDYVFTTRGRLDTLDPKAVLGLFLWQYGPCWDTSYLWWNPYNEIDIEYSRWGNAANDPAQFVAQPYDYPGNIQRYPATFSSNEVTSHAFRWLADRVEYRAWRGGPADEATSVQIRAWTYTGPHIPRPEQPRVHMNLWQNGGAPATNQEVVFDAFTFVSATPTAVATPPARGTRLFDARPNPFNPSTTITYRLARAGQAELVIFDVSGRRVRVLVNDAVSEGDHDAMWDGRDDHGRLVSSGVYFYRLRAGGVAETKKMVLLK